VKITVVRPGELGPGELERWRAMQHASPTLRNPFLSPEFTLAVGAARDTARVAVLQDGQQIVGFFPHEWRGRFLGTAIGAGISDCQGMVHAPGLDWDPMELVRACRLPVWEFDHLLADQAPFARYHTGCVGSPVMDLSGGFPEYLAGRAKATNGSIADIRRKTRKLEREIGPLRFEYQTSDAGSLQRVMDWKSAQYHRTRAVDQFRTPWVIAAVTELYAARTAQCRGTLSMLYAGERPVAAHFGIRSESVLSYWFPAYDMQYARYSAGLALLLRMAESAAAEGIDHIDLGRGQARYKDGLKTHELPIAAGRVSASWPVGAARRTQLAVRSGVRQTLHRPSLRHVLRLGKLVRQVASRG